MRCNSLEPESGTRRYDLDWVRIGAFMLLICYHVGMYRALLPKSIRDRL